MNLLGAATVQLHWFGASVQKNKCQLVVSPCLDIILWSFAYAATFQDTQGHIIEGLQIVWSIKWLGWATHQCISVFLTKTLHYLRGDGISPAASVHIFSSYPLFFALKVMIFFLPTGREGLCQERERERGTARK